MLTEAAEIEELADVFGKFCAMSIERRSAISERHVVVTKGNGVHNGWDYDLNCGETTHDGANDSLDVDVSFDDDGVHGAIGGLETDVVLFAVETF